MPKLVDTTSIEAALSDKVGVAAGLPWGPSRGTTGIGKDGNAVSSQSKGFETPDDQRRTVADSNAARYFAAIQTLYSLLEERRQGSPGSKPDVRSGAQEMKSRASDDGPRWHQLPGETDEEFKRRMNAQLQDESQEIDDRREAERSEDSYRKDKLAPFSDYRYREAALEYEKTHPGELRREFLEELVEDLFDTGRRAAAWNRNPTAPKSPPSGSPPGPGSRPPPDWVSPAVLAEIKNIVRWLGWQRVSNQSRGNNSVDHLLGRAFHLKSSRVSRNTVLTAVRTNGPHINWGPDGSSPRSQEFVPIIILNFSVDPPKPG
jgi:hypothetical protein